MRVLQVFLQDSPCLPALAYEEEEGEDGEEADAYNDQFNNTTAKNQWEGFLIHLRFNSRRGNC